MSGFCSHLTPPNLKRKRSHGSVTKESLHGRCKVCEDETKLKYVCSGCTDEGSTNMWFCHSDIGRDGFGKHLIYVHLREQYFAKKSHVLERDIQITLRLSSQFLFGCILFVDPYIPTSRPCDLVKTYKPCLTSHCEDVHCIIYLHFTGFGFNAYCGC